MSAMPARFTCVVAHTRNRVIGKAGAMPWRLSSDLKRFRSLTLGKVVAMGRRTFETLGRPLPQRRNVVLSRNPGFTAAGCDVAHDFDRLCALVGDEECMIIGGSEVYRAYLPVCRRIYFTEILTELDGDAFFPRLEPEEWRREKLGKHAADESNDYAMIFWRLTRRGDGTRGTRQVSTGR